MKTRKRKIGIEIIRTAVVDARRNLIIGLVRDVVICISNSGETSELKATVCAIKNNGGKILGITGNPNSWLAQNSDVHLFAGVSSEGDVLNRAPRASVLAETLVLQRLSIVLQTGYGLTPAQYIKWHPGGMLGRLRKDEE